MGTVHGSRPAASGFTGAVDGYWTCSREGFGNSRLCERVRGSLVHLGILESSFSHIFLSLSVFISIMESSRKHVRSLAKTGTWWDSGKERSSLVLIVGAADLKIFPIIQSSSICIGAVCPFPKVHPWSQGVDSKLLGWLEQIKRPYFVLVWKNY